MHDLIRIKKTHPNAIIPQYQTENAAGFDFHALYDEVILPGETVLLRTGLKVALPKYSEMQIRPRSGLSWKWGAYIPNSPGTVDADYRGEIKIMFKNPLTTPIVIHMGQRIAQGIVAPVLHCGMKEVNQLNDTKRGTGGFGSTDR